MAKYVLIAYPLDEHGETAGPLMDDVGEVAAISEAIGIQANHEPHGFWSIETGLSEDEANEALVEHSRV